MSENRGVARRENQLAAQGLVGRNYLLVIGIDNYTNGFTKLFNAVRDALAFKEAMLGQFSFDEDDLYLLLNEDATKRNIIRTFDRLLDILTEKDSLVFYYSGHGEFISRTERGYWIPFDGHLGERDTYLSNSDVIDFMRAAKARHVFGIVDSCFSAALFRRGDAQVVKNPTFYIPSRWLLTAGRLQPVSDGSLGKNSPFATSLLAILKQPLNQLWVSKICYDVIHGMAFNTEEQIPRGEPLHNVGHQGGEFVFIREGSELPEIEENQTNSNISEERAAVGMTRGVDVPEETGLNSKSLPQLKSYLKNLAAKNLEKALDDVNGRLRDNSYMVNDFILLSAQFNQLKGDKARGIIPYNDSVVRQNQIIASFQSLVDDLEDEDIRW